jgi:hypothetical protein
VGYAPELQVLRAVVTTHPVLVVYALFGVELSTQNALHHEAVLQNIALLIRVRVVLGEFLQIPIWVFDNAAFPIARTVPLRI